MASVTATPTYTIHLPYDGTPVGEVPITGEAEYENAMESARAGAASMARLGNGERAALLRGLHDIVKRDAADFSDAICRETGKPIREARIETDRSLQTILAAAHAAYELRGEVVAMDAGPSGKGRMAMTIREPLGIIGAITPFNVPLNTSLHKIAPALAGGNSVLHKPSDKTPLSAFRLAKAMQEAGVPMGAYNIITGGAEMGQKMVRDPRLAMITFTGSVPVGKQLRAAAGLKKVTLELGSNSGVIVEPDADLGAAASRCVLGSFFHSGQLCISVQRIFVHKSIAADFLAAMKAEAEKLVIDHPKEERADISSLISESAAMRVEEWIQEAVAGGARLVTGGPRRRATIPPTILADVPPGVRISCQEVFGPVVAVNAYQDFDLAIEQVNSTPYGLQAGIFTSNLTRAFDGARRLKFGGVMINEIPTFRADHMPYGGMKDSGLGREGPAYAIHEMTELKLICWK